MNQDSLVPVELVPLIIIKPMFSTGTICPAVNSMLFVMFTVTLILDFSRFKEVDKSSFVQSEAFKLLSKCRNLSVLGQCWLIRV